MKFSDFVVWDAIQPNLTAIDKPGVIAQLVESLVATGQVPADAGAGIVETIMERERLGSTGIGRGVAVPHAKHRRVDQPVGTVGVSAQGVDFESLDGEKTHLFVMLISPPDRSADHLSVLEYVSRQLRHETFCRFVRDADTPEAIKQVLIEADDSNGAAFS